MNYLSNIVTQASVMQQGNILLPDTDFSPAVPYFYNESEDDIQYNEVNNISNATISPVKPDDMVDNHNFIAPPAIVADTATDVSRIHHSYKEDLEQPVEIKHDLEQPVEIKYTKRHFSRATHSNFAEPEPAVEKRRPTGTPKSRATLVPDQMSNESIEKTNNSEKQTGENEHRITTPVHKPKKVSPVLMESPQSTIKSALTVEPAQRPVALIPPTMPIDNNRMRQPENRSAAKLVIGRITVEVIPPAPTPLAPAKPNNVPNSRTASSNQHATVTKTPNLIFGLGQL